MLKFAVNLVGENVNVVAGCELENAAENLGPHEKAGGIVGGIDVDGTSVGPDKRLESGEIVGPAILWFSTPFTDGSTRAFGKSKRALVAGCFDDGVIVGGEQRVIEDENGFLGSGQDDDLIGTDVLVNRGKHFAEPRRARGFCVAAPVFQKSVVGTGFEGEEFFDGLRFGVGRGEQVFGGEFVLAHVLFNAERSDSHEGECPKVTGEASSAKLTGRKCLLGDDGV